MCPRTTPRESGRDRSGRETDDDAGGPSLAPETVLELLDDEYAQAILESTATTAKPARDLVAELDGSKATVYRRLNRLEAAGLVESSTAVHPDGHHRRVYRATLADVTLSLGGDGLRVEELTVAD